MINFPTSLDSLSNPVGTDKVNNAVAALKHSTQHSNANDAIEALEAKVGINGSAVTTSHDYKLSEVVGSDKAVGKSAVQTLTFKTIDADSNTITNIDNADIKTGANIDRSKLASGTANHVIINDGTGVMSSESELSVSRGGTGQSTVVSAFNALSPTTTKGDIIVNNGTDDVRQAVGSNNQILVADSSQSTGVKWALVGTLGLNKLLIDTTSKSINSTGTVYTFSIPGNTLSTNNALRFSLLVPQANVGIGGQLTISATYGGQSIGSVIAATSTLGASGIKQLRTEILLVASGSTSTQKGYITDIQDVVGVTQTNIVAGSNNTMTVDSTSSQTLTITATITNVTFTCEGLIAELIA